jgi:hypothetical protein
MRQYACQAGNLAEPVIFHHMILSLQKLEEGNSRLRYGQAKLQSTTVSL